MSESSEPTLTLDHFVGVQLLTHIVRGHNGVIGLDGRLYRFEYQLTRTQNCPLTIAALAKLNRNGEQWNEVRRYSADWHHCNGSMLGEIRLLNQDELEQIKLTIELRGFEKMVSFHKRSTGDLETIYAIDESWGDIESTGPVVCEIGTVLRDEHHTEFLFDFKPDLVGYYPKWWEGERPKRLDAAEATG